MINHLRMPEPLRGLIHIVVPEHYGSSGAMWVSRFITEAQMPSFLKEYPNLQIIDPAAKAKYQPEEEEPEEAEEESILVIDDEEIQDGYDDSEERWEMYR